MGGDWSGDGGKEGGRRYNYGRKLQERSRGRARKKRATTDSERERESPAHSGKTIQLVNEGSHSTEGEREEKEEKERERNFLHLVELSQTASEHSAASDSPAASPSFISTSSSFLLS